MFHMSNFSVKAYSFPKAISKKARAYDQLTVEQMDENQWLKSLVLLVT